MKRKPVGFTLKRLGAVAVTAAMLTQSVGPVFAVSSAVPGYAGFVSQIPGSYTMPPDPNVMFTLDDSKSMLSDAIPDFVSDTAGMPTDSDSAAVSGWGARFPDMWGSGTAYLSADLYKSTNAVARYLRSSAGNPLYYNRDVTYRPWPLASNDTIYNPDATRTAVNIHGTNPFDTGRQLDITVQRPNSCSPGDSENSCYWRATYYVYTGTTPLPVANPSTSLNVSANFTKVEIRPGVTTYSRAASRTDCTGAVGASGCSYNEEIQNFANWLQYYRSRMLMAKGGIAMAFAKQGTNMRVGFTTINTVGNMLQGVAKFTGARRTSFYNELYARADENVGGGTPLRRAMDDVGKYFQRSNIGNPWAEDPTSTTTVGTEYTCRKSFHILSTDGYWNGATASSPASSDNDTFSGSTPAKPDTTTYTYSNTTTPTSDPLVGRFTIDPFKDTSNSNTLADVAAYYWKTDLRSTLDNKVSPSARDPAFWQHLVTFTVGLGITGTGTVTKTSDGSIADLSTQASRDLLVTNKTALNWTTPSDNDPRTGDDLIHAAMNGRGRYFPATNPTELANGLATALSEVGDQALDQASVTVDSSKVAAGGKLYQATFSPSKWYGRVYAFNQNPSTGAVNNKPSDAGYTNPDQVREASNVMPAPTLRNIFTYSGTTGSTFTWSGLNATQQGHLGNDSNVLDYLRGSPTKEIANGGTFRDRSRYTLGAVTGGVLGDIVNSTPNKGPDFGASYDRLPTGTPGRDSYATFRSGTGRDNIRNTLFVGANDGMLHAFNVGNGIERFAYVPNAVYDVPRSTSGGANEQKLKLLTDPTYTHRFTVDGTPYIADAYIGGAWKSVLAASNGAGARGIYVMDVTNPVVGSATGEFGTGKIMWEFTDANHSDMGFVISYPHIARMRDGTWVAMFGNGYDSVNGRAKLFLINLQTGAVHWEMAVGAAGNNGLSQPNFILNSNREVVAIYAGDLQGKLWKFDVSDSTSKTNWNVAFGGNPLFSAVNAAGVAQPIAVMPEISPHPLGGAMITFGTGKLFESSDTAVTNPPNTNLNVQSLYGIWDKPLETAGISGARSTVLKSQTASASSAPPNFGATTTYTPSWSTQRGWYFDLNAGGERANISPQRVGGLVFMIANTPLVDPCASGGTARLFALSPLTGAAPSFAVFDTNGNQAFESFESGINVALIAAGMLTRPLFQVPSGVPGSTTGTIADSKDADPMNDLGQVTTLSGGVELSKDPKTYCTLEMKAALTSTALLDMWTKVCEPGKARISWRQLK